MNEQIALEENEIVSTLTKCNIQTISSLPSLNKLYLKYI